MCGNGSVILLLLGTCFDMLWSFVVRWSSGRCSCANKLRLASFCSQLGQLCCCQVAVSGCCWMVSRSLLAHANLARITWNVLFPNWQNLQSPEAGNLSDWRRKWKKLSTFSKVPGESSCHGGRMLPITFSSNRQFHVRQKSGVSARSVQLVVFVWSCAKGWRSHESRLCSGSDMSHSLNWANPVCEVSTAQPSTGHFYLHHSGTRQQSRHDPKPVWILHSSVERFPSWLCCCLFFFLVSMVSVLFIDFWLYRSVFLKVLCVVFAHECCIFMSKFQMGPGLWGCSWPPSSVSVLSQVLWGKKAKTSCLNMVKVGTTRVAHIC